ncbi:hypothetical protein ACOJQI_03125 [Bacillus salacetis]|uniref:hypothetical protein n=1 Tax=Bacillus salacetis TaxID=2315464 RepID=UPI003BA18786
MKRYKLAKVLSASALSALIMAGCGNDDGNVTTEDNAEETAVDETTEEEPEQTDQEETDQSAEQEESEVGTRSNPVPMDETATIETVVTDDNMNEYNTTVELTVDEVIRGEEAYQMLTEMNEYNEEAPEGYEWVLVNANVKVVDSETEDYPFLIDGVMDFGFVSENGDVYSGDLVGTTTPEFSFEMYKGGEKEGYLAGLVKTGEDATLSYDSWTGDKVFFNLQ